MGLGISVGIIAEIAGDDEEGADHFRDAFAAVNELLAAHGLPLHAEPEQLPMLDWGGATTSFPYSFLHHLRRAFAHVVADPAWVARPLPAGERPTDDPVLVDLMMSPEFHLLCHSDCEGFYVPVDFP